MDNRSIRLRKAKENDVDLLFKWANDSEVRRNAFHTDPISHEEHIRWFKKTMDNPDIGQYVLIDDDKPIGQVRLSIDGTDAEIDYSVDAAYRGSGYGRMIIHLIKQRTIEDFPEIKRLIGRVKPANVASFYCFTQNGFVEKYRRLEYDLTNDSERYIKKNDHIMGNAERERNAETNKGRPSENLP